MFFDGHGLMNRYRTPTLKEIHKLPKLVMCDVTYVHVSFHIRVI